MLCTDLFIEVEAYRVIDMKKKSLSKVPRRCNIDFLQRRFCFRVEIMMMFVVHLSSDCGSGRRPSKNKEARERRGCYIATTE